MISPYEGEPDDAGLPCSLEEANAAAAVIALAAHGLQAISDVLERSRAREQTRNARRRAARKRGG